MIKNRFLSNSPVSTFVEVIWTITPIIILLSLALPSLNILYFTEETNPFITIKVVGHQWYWSYEVIDMDIEYDSYLVPVHVLWKGEFRLLESDHRVVLPINKDIRVLVTAGDVIHRWSVPTLGIKADGVPGRLNQVFVNVMRPAILFGQCSEICGANHSFIPITVESIKNRYFFKWVRGLSRKV